MKIFTFKVFFEKAFPLFIAIILLLPAKLSSAKIHDNFVEYSLCGKIGYYIDSTNQIRIADILSSEDIKFGIIPKECANFGFTPNTIWGNLDFSDKEIKRPDFIQFSFASIDTIQVYFQLENGDVIEQTLGMLVPFHSREIDSRLPTFKLPEKTINCWFKIRSEIMVFVAITAYSEKTYQRAETKSTIFFCIYFGIIISVLLYNISVYFLEKENINLFYAGYLLGLILHLGNMLGFNYQFFWPDSVGINRYAISICEGFMFIMFLLFTKKILRLKKYVPILNTLFKTMMYLSFLLIILSFFVSRQLITQLEHVLPFPAMILASIGAIAGIKRNHKPAVFFLIGWSCFFIGTSVYILKDFGIIPFNIYTENLFHVGVIIEAVFFSFSVASQVKLLKIEKQEVKENLNNYSNEIDLLRNKIEEIKNIETKKIPGISINKTEVNRYLLDPLTERELDLLFLLAKGKTNKEIANELFVSVNTIKYHLNNIYDKLDVTNRTEAVLKASGLDLLDKTTG